MIIQPTKIKGVYLLTLEPRIDERGYFTRVFCQRELKKAGIDFEIVQINRSLTKEKATIRGLHFQREPVEEDKIIQCLRGEIFDVALDLRKNSPTFGRWIGEILQSEKMNMLLVPKGCAHGFQALTPNCLIEYFVSQFYTPEKEGGVRYNDPTFKINWPIAKAITSIKDGQWPDFKK